MVHASYSSLCDKAKGIETKFLYIWFSHANLEFSTRKVLLPSYLTQKSVKQNEQGPLKYLTFPFLFDPIFVFNLSQTRILKLTSLLWIQRCTPTFLTWLLWNLLKFTKNLHLYIYVFNIIPWDNETSTSLSISLYVLLFSCHVSKWGISSVDHAHWKNTHTVFCIKSLYTVFCDISNPSSSDTVSFNLEFYMHFCFPFQMNLVCFSS